MRRQSFSAAALCALAWVNVSAASSASVGFGASGTVIAVNIAVGDHGLRALLAYIGPHVNPGALKRRYDNTGHNSSLAPSIAAVSENFLPKTPEAQT